MPPLANQLRRILGDTRLTSLVEERFWWPFAAAAVVVLAVSSVSRANQHTEKAADAYPAVEWMRGVPRGCRVVSFDLLDEKSTAIGSTDRVDIVWVYTISDECYETTALIDDIDVLKAELRGVAGGDRPIRRVTVALTPRQANRLQLAAAIGKLRMTGAAGSPLRGAASLPAWDIQGIEDRTQAIESGLDTGTADAKNLERPTLAAPARAFSGRSRGVITVPVEFEFQR